jgi:pimeloyl-ACP methyl ester carboxylesterase
VIASSRALRTIVAATAMAFLLSSCSLLNFGGGGEPTSKPTGEDAPSTALQKYYDQVLVWEDCGGGAECTTAIAPMNWDDPSEGPDVELALTRHASNGRELGSLFVNPGGPGGSGFDFVHDSVDFAVSSQLQNNYDIVGWDPRGVGRSTPVECFDDAELDDYLYGLPAADPDTDPQGWVAEVTATSIAFGQACLENTGPVLQYIDTISTVRDLDMMRAIVGDEKLNYLGYSYGTSIGTRYIDRFPERVGRMVLDGATDPKLPVFEIGLIQSQGFERALQNYLTKCPGLFGDDCPFAGDLQADLATVRSLYDRYDANPIPGADGRLMDAGVLDTAMSMALYSQDSWEYLNDLFSEAKDGITDTAFFLSDYYYSRDQSGHYSDNSFESFIAIYCVDFPTETDPAVIAQQEAQYAAASPTTYRKTPPIGDPTCANWPYQWIGEELSIDGKGAPDTLVISTTGDPATPYEWGVSLSEQLENAHLITYNGEGHTAYNGGVRCVDDAVDDYFIKGTVPSSDPDCQP